MEMNQPNKREKSRVGVVDLKPPREAAGWTDRASEHDRRLDAELADNFPASDPPSILDAIRSRLRRLKTPCRRTSR
jgi:hypothetical protein